MLKKFKQKVICIIPARGGSKGILKKNIYPVNKRPLIYYTIKSAILSGVCDKIIVYTDCDRIAKISKKYGAEVPFRRPKKISGSLATTEKTLKCALLQAEKFYKTNFDICVFLAPTNIFRKISWIKKAVNNLKQDRRLDSSFSVHQLYKHFWTTEKKTKKKVCKWMKNYTSRQIAPKLYREDTGLASATRSKFWRIGKIIGIKNKFIINNDSFTGIDIHDINDIKLAEYGLKILLKKKEKDMILN
jgi:CMP-N-acetylneuraminic acid synthetase